MAGSTEGIERRLRGQLGELRESYDQDLIEPKTARRAEVTPLLVFEVGSAAFAVRADRLVEVTRPEGMVAAPCSPPHVAGAITHRQEVVSVLDLRKLLGIPDRSSRKDEWVLVLRPRSSQSAILADAMVGVRTVDPKQFDGAMERADGTSILVGNIVIDDRPVAIVDIDTLTSEATAT